VTLKLLLLLEFYYPSVAGKIVTFVAEWGSCILQLPSKAVATLLVPLLPEQFQLQFLNETLPDPGLYKLNSLFWAIMLILQCSVIISGTLYIARKTVLEYEKRKKT
jgi:hypothetical protein